MTDTDNTGESAVGYYGDISLVRSPKATETKQKDQKAKETPPKETKPKEQPTKGTKGNGEPSPPPVEPPQPGKATDELKHREPNNKEQPSGTTPPPPTAAPQPAVPL